VGGRTALKITINRSFMNKKKVTKEEKIKYLDLIIRIISEYNMGWEELEELSDEIKGYVTKEKANYYGFPLEKNEK
jgi:hypothetical protein